MKLDQEARAELDLIITNAWNAGRNDRERNEKFIAAVRDAEQAHRQWASELLDAALRDGMWKRLKQQRKALEPMVVKFAHRSHVTPSIGGVARRRGARVEYTQLEFVDMTREELLRKRDEYDTTAFAARRNKFVVSQLIKLIDQADDVTTAREAAAKLKVDVSNYLAIEAV